MPLNRKMLGLSNDEMTLIMELKEIAYTQLEVAAVSHKCVMAQLPLISENEITPYSPVQGTVRFPCSPATQNLLPASKSGSKDKASLEPESYNRVCSPAVLARQPWRE